MEGGEQHVAQHGGDDLLLLRGDVLGPAYRRGAAELGDAGGEGAAGERIDDQRGVQRPVLRCAPRHRQDHRAAKQRALAPAPRPARIFGAAHRDHRGCLGDADDVLVQHPAEVRAVGDVVLVVERGELGLAVDVVADAPRRHGAVLLGVAEEDLHLGAQPTHRTQRRPERRGFVRVGLQQEVAQGFGELFQQRAAHRLEHVGFPWLCRSACRRAARAQEVQRAQARWGVVGSGVERHRQAHAVGGALLAGELRDPVAPAGVGDHAGVDEQDHDLQIAAGGGGERRTRHGAALARQRRRQTARRGFGGGQAAVIHLRAEAVARAQPVVDALREGLARRAAGVPQHEDFRDQLSHARRPRRAVPRPPLPRAGARNRAWLAAARRAPRGRLRGWRRRAWPLPRTAGASGRGRGAAGG